jgi:UDP-N-acetylmuramoylalanine--D-glutamate ligase
MHLIASSQLTIVIGLGITGLSAARFLQKNNVRFMMLDSREFPPNLDKFKQEFPAITVVTGELDAELLMTASEIVISPGMSLKTPALQPAITAGIPLVGDVELFARVVDKPVIAITGSNAKSTVTTLVGEMAVASGFTPAVGGNLGVPVLDLLTNKVADLYVLELSSFQLETTMSLAPKVATVLNVSLDHMDRYDSLAAYHQAKLRIYRHAQQLVINRQDALTHPPLAKDAVVWSFGVNRPDVKEFGLIWFEGEEYLAYQFTKLMPVKLLLIKGKHNAANALAALALGHAAGFDMQMMLMALKTFKGLSHRCEYVKSLNEVMYINDSKGTNVGATLAAIEGFSTAQKNIILIAGGDGKGADFSPLKKVVSESVRLIVLIGKDAKAIHSVLVEAAECQFAESLKEAVLIAKSYAQQGDVVLLSPACASFDMFSGFEDRGKQFVSLVESLAA